ncbi:VIT1/CCC1 family predicted Fe2+/Mn2+ transporter [Parabacteroides sp. PF5-5]|uniref:hypothetical protein n=1 Tax=unclassified Parabacteroides TaxID=2649774 RepID=UPI00247686F4|nr:MULTISPECIES: hypothetical protein [unclassified Parabacteroides]MDH6303913.1 VIT1/CCC1 family predicted Fe2+/Mn2+ transporter [Parabacteroides sp. PH5-39]MDH6314530.1 VIT1/CCC1 family predicted Fe2+/Mn2+ transporter [Parabacteroides sp. PF5-13]MDH6318405.1 VIT1/CCC1 family predicted Fe2+/Mn2+ transporter [Parabacteroides sp. PH5-13]MDH6322302.1 VIT1/CCC1 family predicted Fe2+/Mn2+ transporter [Parabacteroides sp. PH5-8]MDH6325618.1 VIT1/CCC1 family predicted Fe2+/Mn2+ transporter [Parabact
MRFFLGVLVTAIVLTGAILTVLALWGIQPISWTIVWKSGMTILIVFGTFILAYLCYIIFFKNYRRKDK